MAVFFWGGGADLVDTCPRYFGLFCGRRVCDMPVLYFWDVSATLKHPGARNHENPR